MGLSAFAIATVAGLAADNPMENILMRAVVSMFVCHATGFVLGLIGEHAVREGVEKYVGATPVGEAPPIPRPAR